MDPNTRWNDARRLESWAGEIRVNAVRALALVGFYGHHLLRVHVLGTEPVAGAFHHTVTAIAAAWALLVIALRGLLNKRFFPPWLKYAVVAVDLALVTLLLIAAGGPKGMLVVLYLLVLATAALRLSLKLVWTATAGALGAYLSVVAWTIRMRPAGRIEHTDQVIFMLALLATGMVAGQSVRQARRLVIGTGVDVEESA